MILSGPKDWRGSTKDARILPHFLHSAVVVLAVALLQALDQHVLTRHRRRERIVDPHCERFPRFLRETGVNL